MLVTAWDEITSAVNWLRLTWDGQSGEVKALILILACLLAMYQASRSERLTLALYVSAFGFFAAAAAIFYAAFISAPLLY